MSGEAATKLEDATKPATETESKEVVQTEEVKVEDVKLEEKKEEVVTPPKAKSEMNLAEIVVDYLGLEKPEIELTPKLKKLMQKISTVEKSHLDNIEHFFTKIVEDKEINMKDMPELVGLMQELFVLYNTLRLKVDAYDIGTLFKVLIQILVLYRLDNSDKLTQEQKDAIVNTMDTIVGLCSQMIELKDAQKALKKWCVFIPCL